MNSHLELFRVFIVVVLAENGRLRYVDSIAKRFLELTMAHKGEVKAVVTTVIVSFSFTVLYVFVFNSGKVRLLSTKFNVQCD